MLAGLDVEAAVTTNYDNGYELASVAVRDPSRPLRVLPREYAEPGLPWLLKREAGVASWWRAAGEQEREAAAIADVLRPELRAVRLSQASRDGEPEP